MSVMAGRSMIRQEYVDPAVKRVKDATSTLHHINMSGDRNRHVLGAIAQAFEDGGDPNAKLYETGNNYLQTIFAEDTVYRIKGEDEWAYLMQILELFLGNPRFDAINHRNRQGECLIHTLSALGRPEFLERICRVPGIDVNVPICGGARPWDYTNARPKAGTSLDLDTPMHIVCRCYGNPAVYIDILLRYGASTHVFNSVDNAPLHVLIYKSRHADTANIVQAIGLLYERGDAKPNALLTKDDGSNILAMAAGSSIFIFDIFKLLLDLGEDPTMVNRKGESALSLVQKEGRTGLVNLFKEWRVYKSGLMRWAIRKKLGKELVDEIVCQAYYPHILKKPMQQHLAMEDYQQQQPPPPTISRSFIVSNAGDDDNSLGLGIGSDGTRRTLLDSLYPGRS